VRLRLSDLLTLSQVEADASDLVRHHRPRQLTAGIARDVTEIAARADVRVAERADARCSSAWRAAAHRAVSAWSRRSFSRPGRGRRLGACDGRAVVGPRPRHRHPGEERGTRFFRASNAVQAEITGTGSACGSSDDADNHGGRLELTRRRGTTARP
jgi:hypothetical protein